MKEALYYEKLDKDRVRCVLCPTHCVINPEKNGNCRARKNVDGKLYTLNYGLSASPPIDDPIEKKPLYHFYPGSTILSLGPNSCNLSCQNCQNWSISQIDANTIPVSPEHLSGLALGSNTIGVAYTYTEPFTWYEFLLESVKLVRKNGLKNVLVTNGYVEEEPLKEILPFIDALNIDLKSMDEDFYVKICSGKLKPVLRTIEIAAKISHIEVTNLIIPTLNDKKENFGKLVDWIYNNAGPDVPLHFSRYFSNYKMKIAPTSISIMEEARDIAKEKLNYVYLGNVSDVSANTTFCSKCQNELIRRIGYSVDKIGLKEGKCSNCQTRVTGIGM